jgi:hypothetical protein
MGTRASLTSIKQQPTDGGKMCAYSILGFDIVVLIQYDHRFSISSASK